MNSTSITVESAAPRASLIWKITLLLIPLVTLLLLIWLRNTEVQALRQRSIGSYGSVPQFVLTNQNGQPFGSAQLNGKIWIADFIFTTCRGPCPMISARMSGLQAPLAKTDVQLVSFTVDPANDAPAVLHKYAEALQAEPGRWNFLTGSQSTLYQLFRDGFKVAVAVDGETGGPVHSTRMVLVDRHGEIRGYYNATEPESMTKLIADTNHLLREQPR